MDPIHQQEQEHLSHVYQKLVEIREDLDTTLNTTQKDAARDLRQMSEEIRPDFGGADETIETLAAIETLNSVIDTYNQYHDFTVEKLGRVEILLRQPYFAKVTLKMRPGRPSRDVYIGAAGITDKDRTPLIVDWRSPVAETYYNQEMGTTSYQVDGKKRTVELELRRQFDITRDKLNLYFDTTVAIEDSLLLAALKRQHTEKLQAITATIQREQNVVVRHEDVPVLLVNGIAGSGKTSVLLQRIAYLLYQQRTTLTADQVYLFTPNEMFGRYINTVLPSMGEHNPQVFTWDSFLKALDLADHASGAHNNPDSLKKLEGQLASLELYEDDFKAISVEGTTLIKPAQVASSVAKFSQFPVGPRLIALAKDELHTRLERRLGQMAHNDEIQEEMLSLDVEQQLEVFGRTISPSDEEEVLTRTREFLNWRFASAHEVIESASWLRIDRIGMRMLNASALSGAECVYLRLLITGAGEKNVKFVMIDEVQDYTETQLMVLGKYFSRAHFLLLGDSNQAIWEDTATFEQIEKIFSATHGEGAVSTCKLLTSYRSSPEITALFTSLLSEEERGQTSSVQRGGKKPEFFEVVADNKDTERAEYLQTMKPLIEQAQEFDGLTAIVCTEKSRVRWLAKQLEGVFAEGGNGAADGATDGVAGNGAAQAKPRTGVKVLTSHDSLPAKGVVLLDLALAKGLEFDQVIVADAQEEVYKADGISRRRLYTALSRAMHHVMVVSQGKMTPLLSKLL